MGFSWHHPLKIQYLDKGGCKFNPENSFELSNNFGIQKSVQSEICLNSKKNAVEIQIRLFESFKKAVFVIYKLNIR